jgi:hypothetical protein
MHHEVVVTGLELELGNPPQRSIICYHPDSLTLHTLHTTWPCGIDVVDSVEHVEGTVPHNYDGLHC